jgi:hypothetical protein
MAAEAGHRWDSYRQSRKFPVNSLDFVKNLQGNCWTDLANIQLRGVTVG